MMIPALSVKQPHADLIARGTKVFETRTWMTRYRGPLVICSSRLPKGCGVTGRALCVSFLRHCRPMTPADEAGACCQVYDQACVWELLPERRIVLKAMEPVRGRLGIFALCLPESEFFLPEERDRVRRWLQWSQDHGYLRQIKEFRARERAQR